MKHSQDRRILGFATFLLLAAASAFAASLPGRWHAWKYSREISSGHPGALNYITVSPDLLAHSAANISDLRILDESGAEAPYVLRTSISATKAATESWPATIRENSFVPGKYTQLVLDLGVYPRFHNAVKLDTPESDYILWIGVDASDDARTWRIVKERAPISSFRHSTTPWEGNQTVNYSENNARYLRVQIREPEKQFPVTRAAVFASSLVQKEIVPEQRIMLQGPQSPYGATSLGDSAWGFDLGTGQMPVSSLEFTTDQVEFYRCVSVTTSADGKQYWDGGTFGEIYRYMEGSHRVEKLSVPINNYSFSGNRYWHVEVKNLNDERLSNVKLSVFMVPKLILFRPAAGHSYRLAYGNEKAPPPQYDLERTLHVSATEEAFPDTLANEEENNTYQDPRPFSERHPALLWTALALAAVALGYTALRTMRTPPAPSSN